MEGSSAQLHPSFSGRLNKDKQSLDLRRFYCNPTPDGGKEACIADMGFIQQGYGTERFRKTLLVRLEYPVIVYDQRRKLSLESSPF